MVNTIVWFRRTLRIHDHAALTEAATKSAHVIPVYCMDAAEGIVGPRQRFLVESLQDLDRELETRYGTGLFVMPGSAPQVLASIFQGSLGVDVNLCVWDADSIDPFSVQRDAAVLEAAREANVEARAVKGAHTLWDVDEALAACNHKPPISMPPMVKLADKLGKPRMPLAPPQAVPMPPPALMGRRSEFRPPAVDGRTTSGEPSLRGGETAGLERLAQSLARDNGKWAAVFEKPKTRSTLPCSTTLLSPYVAFGCVSVRKFYHDLQPVLAKHANHAKPPTSLVGQLFFREIAYMQARHVGPKFCVQKDSPVSDQIPWRTDDEAFLEAWQLGKTGFPFIDACMRQLRTTGYLHHLARHAVSCFLTRGDLWVSWEKGAAVFEARLLDSDWAINTFNWLWLAGVAPWSAPYFRVYNPVPAATSALNVQDPNGDFVRTFVPELANFPAKYIYEPWRAPIADQRRANCTIGQDYPKPIVDHKEVSKLNIANFKAARAKTGSPAPKKRDSNPAFSSRRKKTKT